LDALQQFLKDLPEPDKELIKPIPLEYKTDELLKLDHEQFRDLISLSQEELSKFLPEQLERRDQLIVEIKRIRTRLIIEQHARGKNRKERSRQQTIEEDDGITAKVSDAIRQDSGPVIVSGMIVSISAPFKMISKTKWICRNPGCDNIYEAEHEPSLISLPDSKASVCPKCHGKESLVANPEYINAKTIQIQDSEPRGELERLDVFLYEDDTHNVNAGEIVEIRGNIHIQTTNNSRSKKLFAILHADSIKYKHREETNITPRDIEAFQKFANLSNLVDRLVSMCAPNVIGHKDKKLGILRSAVGASEENGRRGRINTLLVGNPGTAKSMLAREATKLLPNSRYITAQNASGKSLTAIIDKENDTTILRLGPIPLSKNSICAINEIGSMSFEDQRFLLDIMEEGKFTIDKYAIHQDIDSPTTIIATSNPYSAYWKETFKINNEEIPVTRTLLDRVDQLYAFSDINSEEEIREYASKKAEISKRRYHNYNFLKKYLLYARSIKPEITPEAVSMLGAFWARLKMEGIATNRTLDSIYRIAEATARLKLKDKVDGIIATEVMESIQVLLLQYGRIKQVIEDPRNAAEQEIVNIVRETSAQITFSEAVKMVCHRNTQVKHYLGNRNLTVDDNKRFRDLRERFLNNKDSRIIITQLKPLTLVWSEDTTIKQPDGQNTTDPNDPTDLLLGAPEEDKNNFQTLATNRNPRSDRSDRSDSKATSQATDPNDPTDRHQESQKFEYECHYCNKFRTSEERTYQRHVLTKHPGKLCYPSKTDLEKLGIQGKGRNWE
jgi:DNA replicative helicase MCM subunit Mcm2 (Cdc46/Mcm family)